jgi:hypothetical protein
VPTYETHDRFENEYRRLSPQAQAQFRTALREFIRVFRDWENSGRPGVPRFPRHLGVRYMVKRPGFLEFAWAPDGRCTWEYGPSVEPGRFHVIWRRIGSHAIYNDP